jgi:hypothetical protein
MDAHPKEFKDVTLYFPGGFFGNIVRIDVRWAKIWVGQYAQHKEYVLCECVEKGKRKPISPDCGGYLVVVPTTHAIQPDELFLPSVPSGDGTYSSSPTRYSIGDSRWRAAFDDQLVKANVPILADYRKLLPEVDAEDNSIPTSQIAVGPLSAPPTEPTKDAKDDAANLEYEEGVRHLAERSFFERNPKLAERAKAAYTCVCRACGFDFAKTYGEVGQGFAEVHHLNPLSERPSNEWTAAIRTSIAEVAVLCANCHRMIHRRRPAFTIEELRAMLSTKGGAERDG